MRLAFLPLFLTLVVATSRAAPDTSIQPPPIQTKETFQKSNSTAETDAVQATEAPAYDPRKVSRGFRTSDGSTNLSVGMLMGKVDKEKEDRSLTTFHLHRTQYNLDETAQEFGLNLTTGNHIGWDWGFKTFCCFRNFASSWAPFYKFGAAAFYESKDQLANLIDYKRYFFQASLGFENLFSSRRTWRLEIGARAGYPGFHTYAQIIYAFQD